MQASGPDPAPAIDLSGGDAVARAAHERAEAERKAAFDKAQAERRAASKAELDRIAAMPDADAQAAATSRVADGIERITRRNMKEAVAAHLSERIQADPAFAKASLRPGKTLQALFRRINEKAREYLKQEAEAAGEAVSGALGGDVPDDLVYQWAADFMLEEPEEHAEAFVPKPYVPPKAKAKSKGKPKEKPAQAAPKAPDKPPAAPAMEQLSLI
ncbi:Cas9 inhibitor AcrIIA9 family protein [uncultured Alistipes sp.]|uniref:Cas9 inhibitor AcrIIA9 family protein n=1 Tax=uncultured Alistipes sp. TaxID=538949 RepID=UPI00272B96FA|nr:Cas9 inhibitor AcrIIA9 family protein [uncultured Alistipes sp.]